MVESCSLVTDYCIEDAETGEFLGWSKDAKTVNENWERKISEDTELEVVEIIHTW